MLSNYMNYRAHIFKHTPSSLGMYWAMLPKGQYFSNIPQGEVGSKSPNFPPLHQSKQVCIFHSSDVKKNDRTKYRRWWKWFKNDNHGDDVNLDNIDEEWPKAYNYQKRRSLSFIFYIVCTNCKCRLEVPAISQLHPSSDPLNIFFHFLTRFFRFHF